jgi:thiol-disulfide isomerase/thioredoxin
MQSANCQSLNEVVFDDKGQEKLLGIINKKGLEKAPFNVWFNPNYDNYLVNDKIIEKLKDSLNQYTIKVFLGTWCGDSKLEVPHFYNILEATNFPESQLEVIALDNTKEAYKQAPNHEEKGLNIHRVPTFIFYKDGKEYNRIVEHPNETLERDMLKIVTDNKYSPNYMAANYLNYLLQEKTLDSLKLDESTLVPRLAEFVKGSRELNTFGYSLLRSNQIGKALYVFDLNTKIFPYKYNVYDSLGEAYYKSENYVEALKNYYKVLSLNPDDKNAVEMIEKIKQL